VNFGPPNLGQMKSALALIVVVGLIAGCGTSSRSSTLTPTTRVRPSQATVPGSHSVRSAYVAPVATIQLVPPLAKYAIYVDKLVKQLRWQLGALHLALLRRSVTSARSDWITAHFTWLELGQDDAAYGAFGQLGEQIDGLAAGLPGTIHNLNFTGFHKIELDLWRRNNPAAAAVDTAHLQALVTELSPARIQHDLPLTAIALDGWVLRPHEILEDALRDSLSQDDDYGSNSDLASLAADVDSTEELLSVLQPVISPRRPRLVPQALADLHTLAQAIIAAGGPSANRNVRRLALRKRQALDAATSAVAETLAPVSEILQVTVPGS
jgi:high-affinity iron transporter